MSGLFNKKFTSQQLDIQEGQVPDDLSDQPAIPAQKSKENLPQDQTPHPEEDQFIFETLPDKHFESDYPSRDKNNFKSQDFYGAGQSSQRKDWDRQDRNDRDKRDDKNLPQKLSQKKQNQNYDNKRKTEHQEDLQMRPVMISQPSNPLGYYPGMAPSPIGNPYATGYYPPYGAIPPNQPVSRPPYGIYPQLHHQPPPGMFVPGAHQNLYPVSNPNVYQIPPPPIAYGSMQPIVQPIPPQLYHPQGMEPLRPMSDQSKTYNYQQPKPYPQTSGYNQQKPLKQYQNKEREDYRQKNFKDKQFDNRYPEERDRSRDKKDFNDYEVTKSQQKPKYYDKGSYQRNYKERSQDHNDRKLFPKDQKKRPQDEDKIKLKKNINEQLKIIFASNQQEKQEFLLVLRDVIKHKLLKKQEEEIAKYNGFEMGKPLLVYTHNKQTIESNYQKALLKLEHLLISLAQNNANTEGQASSGDKKDALVLILTSFQLEDLVSKVKEMRLKKKLIGERKMSEIKKLLEQLVKDPRKRIK